MRMPALIARLESLLHGHPEVELRVLPDSQIVIRSRMMPNPVAASGLKAAAEIPSAQGYEIYVSCRGPATAGTRSAPSAQLRAPAMPFPPDGRLGLEPRARAASWHFLNRDGDAVAVRVRLGSRAPREEVEAILGAIEAGLLR